MAWQGQRTAVAILNGIPTAVAGGVATRSGTLAICCTGDAVLGRTLTRVGDERLPYLPPGGVGMATRPPASTWDGMARISNQSGGGDRLGEGSVVQDEGLCTKNPSHSTSLAPHHPRPWHAICKFVWLDIPLLPLVSPAVRPSWEATRVAMVNLVQL